MTTIYTIRSYIEEDFDLVVASYIDVFSSEPWNDDLTVPQIESYLKQLSKMNTFLGYIFEDRLENRIVGCALGFVRPWYKGIEYHMDTFYILTDHQQKGLGKIFLSAIKTNLSERQIPTIILDTDRETPAEKFYLQNNFTSSEDSLILFASTSI